MDVFRQPTMNNRGLLCGMKCLASIKNASNQYPSDETVTALCAIHNQGELETAVLSVLERYNAQIVNIENKPQHSVALPNSR